MPRAPLIPPHEAPPSSWRKAQERISWRLASYGAIAGAIVGLVAFLLGASPWWWLAMPIGFGLGSASDLVDAPVLWTRK
jgi:hypothetical protein